MHVIIRAERQTLLTPVVAIAPSNLQRLIQKPVSVRMPHCASQLFTNWLFHVYRSDTLDGVWHRNHTFVTGGGSVAHPTDASANNGVDSAALDGAAVRVLLGPEGRSHGAPGAARSPHANALRLALAGETNPAAGSSVGLSAPALKLLRIAAFASATPTHADYAIRLYVLDDTQLALAVRF